MVAPEHSRLATRVRIVQEHVRLENLHDLDGIMQTFGTGARYDDEPWDDHRIGRGAVQSYYEQVMRAVPDIVIDVKNQHVGDSAIILEIEVTGTHMGTWRGLPGTGRRIAFPLCAVYTFDEADKLAGERIYYDRATILAQLGLFHDPATLLGRAMGSLTHPLTMARVVCRQMLGRRR
jgi:steroid delta-isomerase-like uncharacterized protein